MAPPVPAAGARRGSEFTPREETELISRLHSEALDTPTALTRRLGASKTSHARANPDSSSDSEAESSQHNRGREPKHSRSMSNPFPSLFSSRKRQGSASKPFVDLDQANLGPVPNNRQAKTHMRGSPSMSKDFATGNCMTCASLVKWPKELKVFKCTICMTINDLVPTGVDSQGSKQRHDTSPGPSAPRQPPLSPGIAPGQGPRTGAFGQLTLPISLDQTKHIARQSLRSYVLRRLRDMSAEATAEQSNNDWPLHQDRLHPDLAVRTRGPLEIPPERKGSITKYAFDEEPPLHHNASNTNPPIVMSRSYPSSSTEQPERRGPPPRSNNTSPRPRNRSAGPIDDPRKIFKPLEDYITNCFNNFECINSSFSTQQHPRYASRSASDTPRRPSVPFKDLRQPTQIKSTPRRPSQMEVDSPIFDLDPKLLMLGDVAENGLWWTGQDTMAPKKLPNKEEPVHVHRPPLLTKSPQLNWADVDEWYSVVNNAAEGWFKIFEEVSGDLSLGHLAEQELYAIEQDILKGQAHTQRVLLKVTENLLKRPGRPIKDPMDLRFLLIIMENPALHADNENFHGVLQLEISNSMRSRPTTSKSSTGNSGPISGLHSGIIKRIVGLISNSSADCQNQMVTWLARYHAARFIKVKELVSGFLTYRMIRQSEKKQSEQTVDLTAGLIPQMQTGRYGGASLHDAIGGPRPAKKPKEPTKKISYSDDWQIKATSRVLSLLFSANNVLSTRRGEDAHANGSVTWNGTARAAGYFLPPTDFYNSMIDYADLIDDFESWESKRSKFSFCQYPFLLSIWAKTHIMEHDARRQMQSKARDAFFDSIMTRRNINQYLVLDVRRDCLVDDSLTAVSSVIGSGGEDLKKGLRISFQGEEGIDAGGLRKEWFLLLIREVFNPDYGMFIYDDDSRYCYFNPNSFEPADQFFLVGVVMGLAIYNSTILDVALPPFAFRKLLASAPSPPGSIPQQHRPTVRYTLDDLAEYRPRLANGLRQLLNFDGDVQETFCLDFAIETDKYGSKIQVPLCPGGEHKPVTNENRREYVDLYVRYILDTAVKRQFEPFKRGFYTVCGGNAFSLFRPEEIELLIRGSDESLDIASLRAVAEYDNWEAKSPAETEPVVGWFWETFEQATPSDQRKLLTFVTGSDRIPAMGAASLTIKLSCLGDDCGRYPIARTCFNMLSLWRYESKQRLESMLWRAVHESEGFGLK
ncbi:other hect domain ubiquitin ligase e3 [Trichoderma arundinaceum]|uniref:HECT-type E3 ubiquitin transferase n=1 Tax=Trichoderma arundinaceum TaxID=490622 RepID=A0A395NY04_TRIAR|nr:other hect domain ubiquitin ligase e3 [Trichoderma arundinaceum]